MISQRISRGNSEKSSAIVVSRKFTRSKLGQLYGTVTEVTALQLSVIGLEQAAFLPVNVCCANIAYFFNI